MRPSSALLPQPPVTMGKTSTTRMFHDLVADALQIYVEQHPYSASMDRVLQRSQGIQLGHFDGTLQHRVNCEPADRVSPFSIIGRTTDSKITGPLLPIALVVKLPSSSVAPS